MDISKFTKMETVIGHITTNTGGLLITDAVWEQALPYSTQENVCLDLELQSSKIPVIAVMKNGRRFLILDIDGAQTLASPPDKVAVDGIEVDPETPEEEEDKDA